MAPDQFSIARLIGPKELVRCVTHNGIYPLLPAPNGVPWSEYVRQRNRSRSVPSSTDALDSYHARYVTCRIAQHARSMATSTRSLPTNSPVPYYQPFERGPMSEGRLSDPGSQEGMYIPPYYVNPWEMIEQPGGNEYHPNVSELDRVSTYTGLDDYDTLFAARHGRGALDPAPRMSEQMIMTPYMVITPTTLSTGLMVNPLDEVKPPSDIEQLNQREHASMTKDPLEQRVVSSSSEIIGEGAAIFTDMTETTLNTLDQCLAMSSDVQKLEGLPIGEDMTIRQTGDDQRDKTQGRAQQTADLKERYPDLFLPVTENHRISDQFCGYSDSLSADNNPMVLVELKSLSYQYGTSIYVVDRVNGTMYGKFSVGYKIIPEKATVIPQFQLTPMEDEYRPTYVNTLPGTTDIVTPITKSMPVTQASQMPVLPNVPPHERDILEPMSNERARSVYLEKQMQSMSNVKLPLGMPSLENVSHASIDLPQRIHTFCQEWREKRRHEWESLKVALEKMKESKEKCHVHQAQEERDATYAQMAQSLEKTRAMVRNSVSRASTISAEEHQLTLTEDDFMVIQKKNGQN